MERSYNYEIMAEIKARWSPRAFSEKSVPRDELMALLEAARYAPSCNNEQPWRFIIADNADMLVKMRTLLNPGNREWADRAPALILITAKKTNRKNGRDNYWHMFDAGTAWGFLSLEAQRRGFITHAMGGFNIEKARRDFNIPTDYSIITVVAIGYYGDSNDLSEKDRMREQPNTRMEAEDLILT